MIPSMHSSGPSGELLRPHGNPIRRIVFLGVLVLLSSAALTCASAQDIEIPCDGSPGAAVLKVPPPGDRFLRVLCSKFGHLLAPVAGWFWTQPGAYAPVFFPAQMVQQNPKESGTNVFFKSIAVDALSGKAAQDKWSPLAELFPHESPPEAALEVIAENNSGERHRIYIFPNSWGYSCSPTCRKENAFILISQTKETPKW